jgi:hypothetical protein
VGGWWVSHTYADGTYHNGEYLVEWICADDFILEDPSAEDAVQWRTEWYREYEYPLGRFAAWVSNSKGNKDFFMHKYYLYDALNASNIELPDHTDVTELFVRSETVCGIVCDVYKDRDNSIVQRDYTFWVDPATGFTLKYESRAFDGTLNDFHCYEVTSFKTVKPDWEEKSLLPKAGDTWFGCD